MPDAPTLRAHPNVIDLAEWKRRRMSSQPVRFEFIGWRAAAEMLTPEEIATLRREAKETSAFARKGVRAPEAEGSEGR